MYKSAGKKNKRSGPRIFLTFLIDVVYTITYSIMLLNTDLHLVQISSHAKMSCALFCENTMSTVLEQNISLNDHELTIWKEQLQDSLKVCLIMTLYTYN